MTENELIIKDEIVQEKDVSKRAEIEELIPKVDDLKEEKQEKGNKASEGLTIEFSGGKHEIINKEDMVQNDVSQTIEIVESIVVVDEEAVAKNEELLAVVAEPKEEALQEEEKEDKGNGFTIIEFSEEILIFSRLRGWKAQTM